MTEIQNDQAAAAFVGAEAAERKDGWAELVEIGLILILAIVPMIRALAPGRVFVPGESLAQFDPGDPRAQAQQSAIWVEFAVEQLKDGNTPLWYPAGKLGLPLIGIGKSGILFPTTFLHLLLPPAVAWALGAWIKFALAGVGAWLLARQYRLDAVARLTAALAYMFCGLMTLAPHGGAASVAAMIPWMILAIAGILRRATPARIAVGALAIGLTLLGGDPPAIISAILDALIYLAFATIIRTEAPATRVRNAGGVIFALLIGILLAGSQLSPLVEYIANLPMISVASALRWHSLPLFDGASRVVWWSPAIFGGVLLVLVVIAIVAGRRDSIVRQSLIMTAALLLLEAIGVVYVGFRLPASIAMTLVGPGLLAAPLLSLAILAGVGIAQVDRISRLDVLRKAAIIVGVLAVACVITGIVQHLKTPWILTKGVRLFAAAVALGLVWVLRSRARPAAIPVLALAAVELLSAIIFYNTAARGPMKPLAGELPAIGMPTFLDQAILAKDSPASRVFRGSAIVWTTSATEHLNTREEVLAKMDDPSVDPMKIIVSDRTIENPFDADMLPATDQGKLPWFTRTATNSGPDFAAIKLDAPGNVEISVSPRGGGWLALRQRFYPGWQAQVITPFNPAIKPLIVPIVRAYGCMQCILLPRSASAITFVYEPQSWRWGCFASAAGGLGILLLLGLTVLNTVGEWKEKRGTTSGA